MIIEVGRNGNPWETRTTRIMENIWNFHKSNPERLDAQCLEKDQKGVNSFEKTSKKKKKNYPFQKKIKE